LLIECACSGIRATINVVNTLPWILQICDALAYLHRQSPPVIHRDIKPANIKIRPDGRAFLVDFGIAKFYNPHLSTTMGAKAVTPGYSPPEQYGNGRTDARSDIYSLGATLFHLLALRPPAEAKERFLYPHKQLSLREFNPSVSSKTEQAILHALAMHPDERPATAADFKEELLKGRSFALMGTNSDWWLQLHNIQSALLENKTLLAVVGLLLALAMIVTLFAPTLPQP